MELFQNEPRDWTNGSVGVRTVTVPTVDQSLVPRTHIWQLPVTLFLRMCHPLQEVPALMCTYLHTHTHWKVILKRKQNSKEGYLWAGRMVRWIKERAAKADHLSLILKTHKVEENWAALDLSSGFHTCVKGRHMPIHMYMRSNQVKATKRVWNKRTLPVPIWR